MEKRGKIFQTLVRTLIEMLTKAIFSRLFFSLFTAGYYTASLLFKQGASGKVVLKENIENYRKQVSYIYISYRAGRHQWNDREKINLKK